MVDVLTKNPKLLRSYPAAEYEKTTVTTVTAFLLDYLARVNVKAWTDILQYS